MSDYKELLESDDKNAIEQAILRARERYSDELYQKLRYRSYTCLH